jgi:Bacterial membrane protein YfhO
MRKQSQAKAQASIFDQFAQPTEQHGEFKFAGTDLSLPAIAKDQRVAFSVPPIDIDRVALITNLAWSENVPDNVVVARLRLKLAGGGTVELPMRAGVDTSEWAHDRRDINARIRHHRATVATSYEVNDASGGYQAHTYLASLSLPRLAKIVSGEIVLEQIPNAPDLTLSVFRVSLANSTTGETFALRRDSVAVERTIAAANAPAATSANERWKLAAQTKYVQIYENTHALPRAWLTSDVRVLDEPSILEVIRNGKFQDGTSWDPERTVLIDSGIGEKQPGELNGSAAITKYEPNRIELNTKANQPSILVLSENHYPGWRAYVDGRFTDTLRVDYNLRGVAVPAGDHKVEFIYRPKSVLIGFVISLLTALGLVSVGLFAKKSKSEDET